MNEIIVQMDLFLKFDEDKNDGTDLLITRQIIATMYQLPHYLLSFLDLVPEESFFK